MIVNLKILCKKNCIEIIATRFQIYKKQSNHNHHLTSKIANMIIHTGNRKECWQICKLKMG